MSASEVPQNLNDTTLAPQTPEPILLRDYLNKLLPLLLGAEENDLKNSLWNFSETHEKLKKFANDPQVNALYIIKEKDEKKDEGFFYYYYKYIYIYNFRVHPFPVRFSNTYPVTSSITFLMMLMMIIMLIFNVYIYNV